MFMTTIDEIVKTFREQAEWRNSDAYKKKEKRRVKSFLESMQFTSREVERMLKLTEEI